MVKQFSAFTVKKPEASTPSQTVDSHVMAVRAMQVWYVTTNFVNLLYKDVKMQTVLS